MGIAPNQFHFEQITMTPNDAQIFMGQAFDDRDKLLEHLNDMGAKQLSGCTPPQTEESGQKSLSLNATDNSNICRIPESSPITGLLTFGLVGLTSIVFNRKRLSS